VPDAVLLYVIDAVVAAVGTYFTLLDLNCVSASESRTRRFCSMSVRCTTFSMLNCERSSSFPVYGTATPYSPTVMLVVARLNCTSGIGRSSVRAALDGSTMLVKRVSVRLSPLPLPNSDSTSTYGMATEFSSAFS
jgi:hypothetical protein